MGLNLNLFVHGVPKGQKIWGPHEDDHIYIESFYGRKTNVEVQLLVEIIQTSKHVNCYYTYFRTGNIFDKDNRAGSYFALTIRSSEYYTDLANMYNILDAAYHKFVLGAIIKSDASITKFIVQDFDQVDKQLQDVEKEIIKYLGSFSIGSDFVSLNGFKVNAEYDAAIINLLDCNSTSLLDFVRSKGNLSVSPLHPTNQIARLTKSKNEEIESIKSQLDQQILNLQNETTQKLNEAIEGKEKSIESIKREYASADQTIFDLKKQLETKKNSVSILENQLNELTKSKNEEIEGIKSQLHQQILNLQNETTQKLKEAIEGMGKSIESIKREYPSADQTIIDLIKQLETIKNSLSNHENIQHEFTLIKQVLIIANRIFSYVKKSFSAWSEATTIQGAAQTKANTTKKTFLEKLNKFHPLVDLIVMVVLIFVIANSVLKSPSNDQATSKVLIEQLTNRLKDATNQLTQQDKMKTAVSETLISSSNIAVFPNARIDIPELSSQNQTMKINSKYHYLINNVGIVEDWKSDDFTFNEDNTISPKKVGDCKINYLINNVIVKSRAIKVVN
jgi:vacuolar-type H+-ATPase subunit H